MLCIKVNCNPFQRKSTKHSPKQWVSLIPEIIQKLYRSKDKEDVFMEIRQKQDTE